MPVDRRNLTAASRGQQARTRTRWTDTRVARQRLSFALTGILVMAAFFGIAVTQAGLVSSQHDLDQLRAEIGEYNSDRAWLASAVEEASAPETIVARAEALGMVRAIEPVYLIPVSPAPQVVPPLFESPPNDSTTLVASAELDADVTRVAAKPAVQLQAGTVTAAAGSPLAGSRAVTAGAASG